MIYLHIYSIIEYYTTVFAVCQSLRFLLDITIRAIYHINVKSGAVIITTVADARRDSYGNFKVCSDMLKYICQNVIKERLITVWNFTAAVMLNKEDILTC